MKKIYVGHSKNSNYIDELYNPIINSELSQMYEFIFPHLDEKTFNSQYVIEKSDLFIAEVSNPSLGLGIEIGRAESKNKKILCIYNEKCEFPSCLKYVNVDSLSYKNKEDMVNKLQEYIENGKWDGSNFQFSRIYN